MRNLNVITAAFPNLYQAFNTKENQLQTFPLAEVGLEPTRSLRNFGF
jgi:hypothetical protein